VDDGGLMSWGPGIDGMYAARQAMPAGL